MRSTLFRLLSGCCACFAAVGVARAEPPSVDFLFPAGATRGATITTKLTGKLTPWPVRVWTNRSDVSVTPIDDEPGTLRIVVADDAAPGVCALRVYNSEGASDVKSFVVGLLPEVDEIEPNDDPQRAQSIGTAAVTINGRFEKDGDADVFAVVLRRGQTLVASLDAHHRVGSPLDGFLQVLSSSGFVLAYNDDGASLDPRLAFVAPADGTYLVRTFCFPAVRDYRIALAGRPNFVYRLTLTTEGFADYAWPLAVPAQSQVSVEVVGWNIAEGIRLPVAATEAARDMALFSPAFANVVAVAVVPHATAAEIEPNSPSSPQHIAPPVTISGRIEEAGDVDTFKFEARKKEPWLLRVDSYALGLPLDPVLTVADASGKRVKRIDDTAVAEVKRTRKDEEPPVGRDAEWVFRPPADGGYSVAVSDLHGRGGLRFAYRLTISRPPDAYKLTLEAGDYVATVGTNLEIPVKIERLHGYAGELEIAAQNLPEGVAIEPVKSSAKGETAKSVKLVLVPTGQPWSGPIRIVGSDASNIPVSAGFSNAPAGGTMSEVWLTVVAAKTK